MTNLKSLLNYLAAGACCFIILFQTSCKKDKGFFDAVNEQEASNLSTYDYLKSKRGIYDSLLYVIDRVGLTDTLKNNKVTLFAPTNESFKLAITNLNNLRKATGKNPLSLSGIDDRDLDTLVTKYIIRGLYTSESLKQQDGLMFYGVRYNRMMHAKFTTSTSSGYTGGGPGYLQFDDTKQSIFTRFWASTTTGSIDIKTKNGIVHVVDPNHVFGFDEFVSRVTFIPKVQTPFLGKPFELPGIINAVDYDLGGPNVAYLDADPETNNGGYYRRLEGVDIQQNGSNGFYVHETVSGEWLEYTVNVKTAGDFEMTVLLGSDQDNRRYSMEVDGTNITGGTVTIPGTQSSTDWSNIKRDVTLTAGKHVIRFNVVSGGFNIYQFIFNARLTGLPQGLLGTWQEHWGHTMQLTLFDYDDNVAIYHDENVYPSITWPTAMFSKCWAYIKSNYGGSGTFGSDPRLRVVMHRLVPSNADAYSGGHPAGYKDATHDFHNTIDCGLSDWFSDRGENIGLPIHEMGHIVEDNIDGIKGSPSGALWGDSKFLEIFNYDVWMHVGLESEGEHVHQQMLDQNPYPGTTFPGVRWFIDWFYPIYNAHGKNVLLYKYFQVLRANYPVVNGEIVQNHNMNLGEFVHFWSAAAGVDLRPQARIAFNPVLPPGNWEIDKGHPEYWAPGYVVPKHWTATQEAQFLQAQKDFPHYSY